MSGYEYEVARPCPPPGTGTCDFTGNNIKSTTSTSASISGLSAKGDYYFQVRAVNPVGKGDWSGDIRATLNPSQSGLLQVSPVTVNVNEGATASYTVRLSHAPPHPVEVQITASGPGAANGLIDAGAPLPRTLPGAGRLDASRRTGLERVHPQLAPRHAGAVHPARGHRRR